MSNINLLDDKTIDKIAAGEVIERPASVVKELVENAIDSGATSISVEIKNGGISYIRVTDNGCGIYKEDVKTAFLRHATSKIKDVMDLYKISSLGFRGEALSSICAVSHVELLTKTHDAFSGTRYLISGGVEELFEEVGVPNGTTIIVKDLFYNTPARLKFLKSPNTEASHITELIEHLILSHPEISFKYRINGIDKIVSSGNGDIISTIYTIYGRDISKKLLPIKIINDVFNLEGVIGKPEIARSNRNFETFFVNKRFVKSKVISSAVEEAFSHRLMLHKYPFVVLYVTIDPSRLDINVHPTKTEIKFIDEILLSNFIVESINNIFKEAEFIPQIENEFNPISFKQDIKPSTIANNNSNQHLNELQEEITISTEEKKLFDNLNSDNTVDKISRLNNITESIPEPFEIKRKEKYDNTRFDKEDILVNDIDQLSFVTESFISENAIKKHKIIGQIFDTYWLVEFNESLYIIDQHAAHEKVLYEKYINRFKTSKVNTQLLSPPIIISLSLLEEEILKKYQDNLISMGFEWDHFGGHEYSLCGVPVDLYDLTSQDYFISVLDGLAEGKSKSPDSIYDRIATMACKAAVKGNMKMSPIEAKALIDELLKLENPYNCPHGRPCIISYTKGELEKLFKRIV